MRREIITGLLMGLGAWQFLARSAAANIISHSCDASPCITSPAYNWGQDSSGDYWLTVAGAESDAGGQISGTVTTDTTTDPTLIIGNDVNNDTGFAWTGYDVTVSMNNPFTLYNAAVDSPSDC